MARDLLDDLDEEQREAAKALSGPVRILAGAGTGKTRTVTYRLAHGIRTGQVDPARALAVTHSKKAAAELAGRLHALGAGGVDTRTFHAAGLRIAGRFWLRTGRSGAAPRVLGDTESWRLWRDCLRAVSRGEPDNVAVRDLIDEVGWARSRSVVPDGYATAVMLAGRAPGVAPEIVTGCWRRYEELKARQERVDFADLLEIAATLLITDEEVAESVRRRWAYVTVDEYQDTDLAQQRLLDAILGSNEELCVVGDPRQAIYSWKGAAPGLLAGFSRRYPQARTFYLTRNYRSSPQILEWANCLARSEGGRPLVPTRPSGPQPKVRCLDNELAEAAWVAGAARRAVAAGTPPSQVAVLYRFNAAQARFEAAFARAGLSTLVAEDVTFFEREEIRSVLLPFGREARAHPRDPGVALLESILSRNGFDPEAPPPGLGAARSRWESLQSLQELVEALPGASTGDAAWLLGEINSLVRRTADHGGEAVTLATMHRAKGLEWEVVFVVGITDGAVPSAYASSPAELAEEERLLHVALSRARKELYLTWASTGSRGWANRPSPFLELLPAGRRLDRPAGRRLAVRPRQRVSPREDGATCAHCASALKGPAARRLGVCAGCVASAPGELGACARAVERVVEQAAVETGEDPKRLVSAAGLMRLLDRRPCATGEVLATPGVQLSRRWASAVADALRSGSAT